MQATTAKVIMVKPYVKVRRGLLTPKSSNAITQAMMSKNISGSSEIQLCVSIIFYLLIRCFQ
jgi:hypothetical protein